MSALLAIKNTQMDSKDYVGTAIVASTPGSLPNARTLGIPR